MKEIFYEVGIPFIGILDESDEVKIQIFHEHNVLSTIHEGEYVSIYKTYEDFWKYIFENNYEVDGFPKEIYLNNPDDVYEEELLTEIQIPIKEKFVYNPEEIGEKKVLKRLNISDKKI